jgi:hypothetical protein
LTRLKRSTVGNDPEPVPATSYPNALKRNKSITLTVTNFLVFLPRLNQSHESSVTILISHPALFTPYQRRIHYSLFVTIYVCSATGLNKPWVSVVAVIKFCKLVPNICGSSEWNLLTVTLQAPRILRWHLDVWKICELL